MKFSNKVLSVLIAGLLASATTFAHADTMVGSATVFTLTDGGSCCSPSPFGTVSLQEWSNGTVDYVKVTETLASGANFSASSGDALEFNVNVANTLSGFTTGFGAGPAPDTAPPFTSGNTKADGDFLESVTCTGCSGGTGPSGPLMFTLMADSGDLTPLNFTDIGTGGVAVNYNGNNIYFASDIFINGNTGNVGAYGGTPTPSPAPEPSSLMLLGTGIIGAAGLLRRRMVPGANRA